jgi:hypothetical protein
LRSAGSIRTCRTRGSGEPGWTAARRSGYPPCSRSCRSISPRRKDRTRLVFGAALNTTVQCLSESWICPVQSGQRLRFSLSPRGTKRTSCNSRVVALERFNCESCPCAANRCSSADNEALFTR